MVLTRSRRLAVAHAPFRILDLSPELVEQIFDQLGELKRSTLFAVRYVCQAFKDLSLVAFGTQFFGCLVAILHPISLATLLEIASPPSLSRFVHQIVIGGERIGGLIDVSGQGNEPMLKDLQTSMENSGMDRLVLTAVFGRLINLQVVRIDTESFHRQIHQIKAIQCGSNCIIERAWKPTDDMDHMRTNRAFDVTLQCLKQAGSVQKRTYRWRLWSGRDDHTTSTSSTQPQRTGTTLLPPMSTVSIYAYKRTIHGHLTCSAPLEIYNT
jgi:hypothetical protein